MWTWGLLLRVSVVDDMLGTVYRFAEWLAPWMEPPGYLGTIRDLTDVRATPSPRSWANGC
jgi:hypothetical protein